MFSGLSALITKITGTPYIEDWANKTITLFASTTKMAGEIVECLRIREIKPQLPELKQNTNEFSKVVIAYKNGYTIENFRTKYTISKEVEELIKSAK